MANRIILNETSYHGAGAIGHLVDEVRSRQFKKAFIVTDKELVKFKVVEKVTRLLDEAGLPYEIFDEVKANPSVEVIKQGVEKFKASGADYLIAIGGGSPIDSSKAIGIIIDNPEFSDVLSLEGVAPTRNKCVPIIAIPTTAGTAAEVTINYVITDEEKKRKFVCVDVHDVPIVALVDPEMMSSMPRGLTAATGMDALTHAIEAYVSTDANPLTDAAALMAITMITQYLPKAVANGTYMKARDKMAYGQYLAGIAFNNASLGYVHAMAHQLGGFYNLPHGVCNAFLLPHVEEFNLIGNANRFRDIAKAMGENIDGLSTMDAARKAIAAIRQISEQVGIPKNLRELGVKEEDFGIMAENAMKDVCQLTNPRKATKEQVIGIFKAAY